MQPGTTSAPAPPTKNTDASSSDDWLAAVHHTGGWRGTGLFLLVVAAAFWGATAMRSGQYAVGATVIAITVVLYGIWLAWDYLTAFLHTALGLQLRRFRMMGVNIVAVSEGLIVDTARQTAYASWHDIEQHASMSTPGAAGLRLTSPARVRRRLRSLRRVTRWSAIDDATPGTVTVDLADFSGHRERSALATAIGMYRPDIADRIIDLIGTTANADTSQAAERPSIENRLPADSDPWLASSFTPTLPAQFMRQTFLWLLPIASLIVVSAPYTSDTGGAAGLAVLALAAAIVFTAVAGRHLLAQVAGGACVFLDLDDPHLERIHRLGTHITATCTGLIVDTADRTIFLPWKGIRTVPQGLLNRAVDITDDVAARATTITGDGWVVTGRPRWRRVGVWRDVQRAQRGSVSLDLDVLHGGVRDTAVLDVIARYCAELSAQEVHLVESHNSPADDRRRKLDLWLADTQLSWVGGGIAVASCIGAFIAVVAVSVYSFIAFPFHVAIGVTFVMFFALFAAIPLIRLSLALIGRPSYRIRWAGAHLAVTAEGFVLTTRGRTDVLHWREVSCIEQRPMEDLDATLLRVPAVNRPTLVGEGISRSHVFPIRFVRRLSDHDGERREIHIDPSAFLSTDTVCELTWRFRPDLAEQLGYPRPGSALDTPTSFTGSFRGIAMAGPDAGRRVMLRLPESRTAIIDYSADKSRVEVHGDLPTVRLTRTGPRNRLRGPIRTYDAHRVTLTMDGEPLQLARIRRSPWTPYRHQYAVSDGAGNLFTLEPDYLISGNTMNAANGIRRTDAGVHVHRLIDGRVSLTPGNAQPGEVALALALAAAFGTRSLQLASIRYAPALLLAGLP